MLNIVYQQQEINKKKVSLFIELQNLKSHFIENLVTKQYIEYSFSQLEICQIKAINQQGIQIYIPSKFQTIFVNYSQAKENIRLLESNMKIKGNQKLFYKQNDLIQDFKNISYQYIKLFREEDLSKIWPLQFQQIFKADFYFVMHQLFQSIIEYPPQFYQNIISLSLEFINFSSTLFCYLQNKLDLMYQDQQDIQELKYVDINLMYLSGLDQIFELFNLLLGINNHDCKFYKCINEYFCNQDNNIDQNIGEYYFNFMMQKNILVTLQQYYQLQYTILDLKQNIFNYKIHFKIIQSITQFLNGINSSRYNFNQIKMSILKQQYLISLNQLPLKNVSSNKFLEFLNIDFEDEQLQQRDTKYYQLINLSLMSFLNQNIIHMNNQECQNFFIFMQQFHDQNICSTEEVIKKQKKLINIIFNKSPQDFDIKILEIIAKNKDLKIDQNFEDYVLQQQNQYKGQQKSLFTLKLKIITQNIEQDVFNNFLQKLNDSNNSRNTTSALQFFQAYFVQYFDNEIDSFLFTQFQKTQYNKQQKQNLQNLINSLINFMKGKFDSYQKDKAMDLFKNIIEFVNEINVDNLYQQEIDFISNKNPTIQHCFIFEVLLKKKFKGKNNTDLSTEIFLKSFQNFFQQFAIDFVSQNNQKYIQHFFECLLIMIFTQRDLITSEDILDIIINLSNIQDNQLEVIILNFVKKISFNSQIETFYNKLFSKIQQSTYKYISFYYFIIEYLFIEINVQKGVFNVICKNNHKQIFEILNPQKIFGLKIIWSLLQKQMPEKDIKKMFQLLLQTYLSFDLFQPLDLTKALFEDLVAQVMDLFSKLLMNKQQIIQNLLFEFLIQYFSQFILTQKQLEQSNIHIEISVQDQINNIYVEEDMNLMNVYNLLLQQKLIKSINYIIINSKPVQNIYHLSQINLYQLDENQQKTRQIILSKTKIQSQYQKFQFYVKKTIKNDQQFGFVLQKLFETDNQYIQSNFERLFKLIPIHNVFLSYLFNIFKLKKQLFEELQPQNNFKFNFYTQVIIQQILNQNKNVTELSWENVDLFIDFLLDIQEKDVLNYNEKIQKQNKIIKIIFLILLYKKKSMYFYKDKIEQIVQNVYQFYTEKNFSQVQEKIADNFIYNISNFFFVMLSNQALEFNFILNYFQTFCEANQNNSIKFVYSCCKNLQSLQKLDQYQQSQLSDFFIKKFQLLQQQNKNVEKRDSYNLQNNDQFKNEYFAFVLIQICLILRKQKKQLKPSQFQIETLQQIGFQQVFLDFQINHLVLFNEILLQLYKLQPNQSLDVTFYLERNILITQSEEMSQNRYQIFQNEQKYQQLLDFIAFFVCNKFKQQIIQLFGRLFRQQTFRSKDMQDWFLQYQHTQFDKDKQYTGLDNLGSTCYINSNLQQLYHIKPFQDFILNLEQITDKKILSEIQQCFIKMKFSQQNAISPDNLIRKMKNNDGTDININEQRDAEEFLVNLMNQIEEELKPISKDKILKNNFMGEVYQEIVGDQCKHKSVKIDDFLTFGVQIKNFKNLNDSLQNSIQWENLVHNNQYFCDQCKQKVDAKKRTLFNKLPNFLIIYLQRFEYDLKSLKKLKINDYFEFPDKLNLIDFCQENVNKQNLQKPQYYQYNLRGVIIHQGSGDSGHYFSYVKFEDWIELNDKNIKQIDKRELAQTAFGNLEYNYSNQSAYILYYERIEIFDSQQQVVIEIDKNKLRKFEKELSQAEYQGYIKNLIAHHCFQKFIKTNLNQNLIFEKISLIYFITYIIRDVNLHNQYDLLKSLEKNMYKPQNALFLLENIDFFIVYECLIDNPKKIARAFFLSLIIQMSNTVLNILKIEQKQKFANIIIQLLKYRQNIQQEHKEYLYFVSNLIKNTSFFKALEQQGLKQYFIINYQQNILQNANLHQENSIFYEEEKQKLMIKELQQHNQQSNNNNNVYKDQQLFSLLLKLMLLNSNYVTIIKDFQEFRFLVNQINIVQKKEDIMNFAELISIHVSVETIFNFVAYLQIDYNNIMYYLTFLANIVSFKNLEGLNDAIIQKVIDFVQQFQVNNVYNVVLVIKFFKINQFIGNNLFKIFRIYYISVLILMVITIMYLKKANMRRLGYHQDLQYKKDFKGQYNKVYSYYKNLFMTTVKQNLLSSTNLKFNLFLKKQQKQSIYYQQHILFPYKVKIIDQTAYFLQIEYKDFEDDVQQKWITKDDKYLIN